MSEAAKAEGFSFWFYIARRQGLEQHKRALTKYRANLSMIYASDLEVRPDVGQFYKQNPEVERMHALVV